MPEAGQVTTSAAMHLGPYKQYVLATLTLVYTLSLLDQNFIILVVQPMETDLGISDSQVGLLTGIAFALFYATIGVPVARWADGGDRVAIATLALCFWAIAVMSTFFAANFLQVTFARAVAAIGAAACMPPTYSLVGDYFSGPAKRAGAMTIYMLASSLACLVSFILGGWVNERYGWRVMFFVMGISGLLTAAVVKLSIIEPRLSVTSSHVLKVPLPYMADVLATVWHQRSSRHLGIALIVLYTMMAGLAPWYAAFMMRSHGMGTAELGLWLGVIFGLGGMAGTLLGGYVAARWFSDDERSQMRLVGATVALLVPCFALFLLLSQKQGALIALVASTIVLNCFLGPTFALMQRLVIDEMRATTLAVVLLLVNLIGMSVGPQTVGILSDLLRPVLGVDSLRFAMLAVSTLALWAACHFWWAGRTVHTDLSIVAGRRKASVQSVHETTGLIAEATYSS